MNTIINNLKRSFFLHIKANLLILINMILSTAAIFVLLQNFYYLRQQYNNAYGMTNTAHKYRISVEENDIYQFQNYLNDELNKSPMYYVGEQVIKELENNYGFTFYNFSGIVFYPEETDNPEIWSKYSTTDEFYDNYTYIDSLLISANANNILNFNLAEGTTFTENDFYSEDLNKPMNVILGYDYIDDFSVGDTFTVMGDTARVIGFLTEDYELIDCGYGTTLDNMVIFPQIFPRSTEDSNIIKDTIMYLYCPDESIDVQEAINEVTTKCGYYTLTVSPIDGIQLTSTKDISEKNVKLIGILAIIACTICALSLASILVNRTLQDRDIFCIYLCCGIPMWKIDLSIAIEMFIYMTLSIFPTVGISIMEYEELIVPLWQILLFAGSITIISLIPTFITNRKCNIDLLIRDRII